MGEITKEQYDYWEGKDDEFAKHLQNAEWGEETDDGTPPEARFDKPFYEYEDICHLSGPEFADSQYVSIEEVDKNGNALKDDQGNFLEEQTVEMQDFESLGAKITCEAEHTPDSESCKNKYYFFGQYFNKGGWYTDEIIKTGPDGFDFKKLEINYQDCDGFKVFNEFTYDGNSYYLQEDSTGKSSSFYVMEGDEV